MKKFMLVCLLLVSLLAVFSAKAATDTVSNQCSQTLHNFSFRENAKSNISIGLGEHKIEGSIVSFEFFGGKSNALYAIYDAVKNVDLVKWNCINEKENQIVVRLYDAGKNLLDEVKTSCFDKKPTGFHFGSSSGFLPFSKVNRQNIGKVKYFSLTPSPCTEKEEDVLYLKDNPELRPLFESSKIINDIIISCLTSGKLECNCSNKDKLKIPVGNVVSFLEKHPKLKGKTLSLLEPKKAGEGPSVSVMLDGIVDLQNKLKSCK